MKNFPNINILKDLNNTASEIIIEREDSERYIYLSCLTPLELFKIKLEEMAKLNFCFNVTVEESAYSDPKIVIYNTDKDGSIKPPSVEGYRFFL